MSEITGLSTSVHQDAALVDLLAQKHGEADVVVWNRWKGELAWASKKRAQWSPFVSRRKGFEKIRKIVAGIAQEAKIDSNFYSSMECVLGGSAFRSSKTLYARTIEWAFERDFESIESAKIAKKVERAKKINSFFEAGQDGIFEHIKKHHFRGKSKKSVLETIASVREEMRLRMEGIPGESEKPLNKIFDKAFATVVQKKNLAQIEQEFERYDSVGSFDLKKLANAMKSDSEIGLWLVQKVHSPNEIRVGAKLITAFLSLFGLIASEGYTNRRQETEGNSSSVCLPFNLDSVVSMLDEHCLVNLSKLSYERSISFDASDRETLAKTFQEDIQRDPEGRSHEEGLFSSGMRADIGRAIYNIGGRLFDTSGINSEKRIPQEELAPFLRRLGISDSASLQAVQDQLAQGISERVSSDELSNWALTQEVALPDKSKVSFHVSAVPKEHLENKKHQLEERVKQTFLSFLEEAEIQSPGFVLSQLSEVFYQRAFANILKIIRDKKEISVHEWGSSDFKISHQEGLPGLQFEFAIQGNSKMASIFGPSFGEALLFCKPYGASKSKASILVQGSFLLNPEKTKVTGVKVSSFNYDFRLVPSTVILSEERHVGHSRSRSRISQGLDLVYIEAQVQEPLSQVR